MLKAPPAVEKPLSDKSSHWIFCLIEKPRSNAVNELTDKKMFVSVMTFSADERKKLICLH